ncbi:MAG: hypothetical protein U1F60_10445 [Planctomycetota bacterium]
MPSASATPPAAAPSSRSRWLPVALVVVVATLGALVVLGYWHFGEPALQRRRLAQLLYFGPVGALGLGLFGACWRWRARSTRTAGLLARAWPGLLAAGLLTVVVCRSVTPEQRFQYDETSLLGVSQNLHAQGLAVMTTGSLPSQGEIVPVANMVDKRPTLFALLVALLHDLRGYDPAHALAANAGLLALLLLTAFLAFRSRGLVPALAAPLLLLAVPLLTVVATSGSFELLATLLFGWLLLAALDVVTAARTANGPPLAPRLANLLGIGVLFAWSRYESLPALLLVLGLVAWFARARLGSAWTKPLLGGLVAIPAMLAPLLPLLLHAQDPRFYPEAGGAALFGFGHLVDHLGPFLRAWFSPSPGQPLPGIVAWAGLAAVVAWSVFVQRSGRRWPWASLLLVAMPVLAVTVLMLFWFYGDVNEPTALRLFLPAAVATALLPLLLVPATWRIGAVVLVLLIAAAGYAIRAVARSEAFPRLADAEMLQTLERAASRLTSDRAHTLWVGTPAQFLASLGYAAVSPQFFLDRATDMQALMRQRDVRTIYLVETRRDEQMAAVFGRPRDVLWHLPGEAVEHLGGRLPITIHRLLP